MENIVVVARIEVGGYGYKRIALRDLYHEIVDCGGGHRNLYI